MSFFNTTLSNNPLIDITEDILIEKSTNLLRKRSGYQNFKYIKTLQGDIMWNFHKPDKDYNEVGLYHNSILVFKLENEERIEISEDEHRAIKRLSYQELSETLNKDGSNGSSYLMKQLYEKNLKELISVERDDGSAVQGIVQLAYGEQKKQGVVFVPGFERYGMEAKWRVLTKKLSYTGIATLQFDFTGLGLSEGDYGKSTIESLSKDLSDISDIFIKNYSLNELTFASHSMGACIALYTKNNYSDIPINKLVFISPALNQSELNRFWFTVGKMKAQKIDVNFESYIDYFQEDEYQQSISSQQTKKTTIMQPTYLLQMSGVNFNKLLDDKVKYFCVLGEKDNVVPLSSQSDNIINHSLIIPGGDHDLEKPGIIEQWVDKVVEFISK